MIKRIIIALIIVFIGIDIFLWRQHTNAHPAPSFPAVAGVQTDSPKQNQDLVAGLDGEMVEADIAGKRPVAVMVENHPDARPQSGLLDADIVYEALAEGGITRFMALYQTRDSANIGPVRSARTYFAEIADEWGAVYAHVGGNSDALANIKAGDYPHLADADQFFNDPYFHRITQRQAPHNMYTSSAKLSDLVSAHQYSDIASFQPWQFKDDAPTQTPVTTVALDLSLPEFAVSYKFDSPSDSYQRSLAGEPHRDMDSGKQIVAKNVVVQLVKTHPVQSDTPLSIGIDLKSDGKAYVFEDGIVIAGTWKKENGQTNYYDQNGSRIRMNRGQTWVELVPDDGVTRVSWK